MSGRVDKVGYAHPAILTVEVLVFLIIILCDLRVLCVSALKFGQ